MFSCDNECETEKSANQNSVYRYEMIRIQIQRTLREAGWIVFLSLFLGFFTTAFHRTGLFEKKNSPLRSATLAEPVLISPEMADSMIALPSTFIIDSRHRFEFGQGHIPKAINIPANEFDPSSSQLAHFPKDRIIVIYCDGIECNSSLLLASKLVSVGFTAVHVYHSGWNDWVARGKEIVQ